VLSQVAKDGCQSVVAMLLNMEDIDFGKSKIHQLEATLFEGCSSNTIRYSWTVILNLRMEDQLPRTVLENMGSPSQSLWI